MVTPAAARRRRPWERRRSRCVQHLYRVSRGWCSDCRATAKHQCWEKHDVLSTKAALRRYLPADELQQAAGQLESLRHEVLEEEMLLRLLTAESWNLTLRDGRSVLKGTLTNSENPVTKALWLVVASQAALTDLACSRSSQTMALESLEQLPDDVLLKVMQFLSVESLLTCRLVCKKLGDLVLHPDVWRHRSLSDNDPSAAAVLYLAPCLKTVHIESRNLALQMTTTRCAVANLDLNIKQDAQASGLLAELAFMIRNQETLGRLKSLLLNIDVSSESDDEANDILVRTLAQCSGLVSLDIKDYLPETIHPVVRGPPRSSLKSFRCILDSDSVFINTILVGHADTLEEVDLRYGSIDNDSTARLLGAMPNLQKLMCVKMPGIATVAACATLRNFSIPLDDYESIDDAEDLAKFLQRARQLKQIELEGWEVDPEVALLVLKALTASGQSRVEKLVLSFENVRALSKRLHKLPALRHLRLNEQNELDDALLRSITPETAANLRLLELGSNTDVCTHAWLHRDAVKTVLAVNPSLHIHILFRDFRCNLLDCEACTGDCHQEVSESNRFGLYSHEENKCPFPENHSTDLGPWIHIPCTST